MSTKNDLVVAYHMGYYDALTNRLPNANKVKTLAPYDLEDDNTKLRELIRAVLVLQHDPVYKWLDETIAELYGKSFTEQAQELGAD